MCIGIITNNSLVGRTRLGRVEPQPLSTSRSTAHGGRVNLSSLDLKMLTELAAIMSCVRLFQSGLELPPGMPGISPALVTLVTGTAVAKDIPAGDTIIPG